ncbi:MAG TPA: pyruvate kinase, partial [Kofleriaceae bacterium]|nr:pyruvate kinase [Kofleriaceae bacterium]
MPRAKIVCTLGPASASPERIGELIDAGMNVARLNFSHGTHEDHAKMLAVVRAEADRKGRAVAVLLDLQGPKIRVGKFASPAGVELKPGAQFTITTDTSVIGDDKRVSTVYSMLPHDVKPGDQILLDDGYLSLTVMEVSDKEVKTVVVTGGVLKNNKGINLPGVEVSAPALSEKDRTDIGFAMRLGVDYVALSFVRRPEDVLEAKRLLTADQVSIPVIAKIEKPQALERLVEIIDVTDGIMVARGDLGVEMGPEKVPLWQKRIIEETNKRGKIVITATQMLESMITQPRPTRAEASDVANAVLDASDALMLSGETASGVNPVEAVRTMARIIEEIEKSEYYRANTEVPVINLVNSTNAIAHAAMTAARSMNLKTIVCVSDSGGAARLVSEYRPEDVVEAKRLLTVDEVCIPVIAKIEKPQALDRLGDIIDVSDGIMVARGDLGVELGPEKVPLWQKRIIEETNKRGKIVITATQMLESMITQPRPTRAEASDVANAVLDATDALMLSGETASGLYPVEAVKTMARIIEEIERSEYYRANTSAPEINLVNTTNAIAHAAMTAARSMKLKTIVVLSHSGGAARLVSEYRPEANIICMTTNEVTFRRLALV